MVIVSTSTIIEIKHHYSANNSIHSWASLNWWTSWNLSRSQIFIVFSEEPVKRNLLSFVTANGLFVPSSTSWKWKTSFLVSRSKTLTDLSAQPEIANLWSGVMITRWTASFLFQLFSLQKNFFLPEWALKNRWKTFSAISTLNKFTDLDSDAARIYLQSEVIARSLILSSAKTPKWCDYYRERSCIITWIINRTFVCF